MELDLQKFYSINRRIVMWVAFFAIVWLLRNFFAVMFLTFIFGFLMRKIARFLVQRTGSPYRLAVAGSYLVVLGLLVVLLTQAIPRVINEGGKFTQNIPALFDTVAAEIEKSARNHGWETTLARLINPPKSVSSAPTATTTDEPLPPSLAADKKVDIASISAKIRASLLGFFPPSMIAEFVQGVWSGTLQFLLAFLLSFLIVLDFDRVVHELSIWRESPVGRFFHQAAASVIEFSEVVGTAFQCQMMIALLNATITCVGLFFLKIEPLALLTTIVLLFGLIPVLGVFISSVPIILIAFNDFGLNHALLALGMIVIVHMLEAYVFNPQIYAARFHLNPVIVLIILLVAHELFGVWGMLLGIPVTHYVLNIAQMPSYPRKHRRGRHGHHPEPPKDAPDCKPTA